MLDFINVVLFHNIQLFSACLKVQVGPSVRYMPFFKYKYTRAKLFRYFESNKSSVLNKTVSDIRLLMGMPEK